MRKDLYALFVVLVSACNALAATDFVFSPVTGDDDWTNAASWTNGVPTLADDAGVADSARIGAATSAEANIFRVGWAPLAAAYSQTGLLTVEGDLTTGHSIRLGTDGPGANGTMVIEAGATVDNQSMSATGEFWVGGGGGTGELFVSGTLNSGSMDITCAGCGAPTKGTVHVLDGGAVYLTDRLTVGFWGGDASLIISMGGLLSTGNNDFWNSQLPGWVTSGVIQAEPGATLVVTPHGFDSGYTLTAVPEPTSLALVLLGLGSVAAVRRGKRT